jgi:hypothetical protein
VKRLADPHNGSPSRELLAAWELARREMQSLVDEDVWRIWLEPVHPHRVIGGVWWLACPESTRDWVQSRWRRLWERACHAPVRFVVCDQTTKRRRQ